MNKVIELFPSLHSDENVKVDYKDNFEIEENVKINIESYIEYTKSLEDVQDSELILSQIQSIAINLESIVLDRIDDQITHFLNLSLESAANIAGYSFSKENIKTTISIEDVSNFVVSMLKTVLGIIKKIINSIIGFFKSLIRNFNVLNKKLIELNKEVSKIPYNTSLTIKEKLLTFNGYEKIQSILKINGNVSQYSDLSNGLDDLNSAVNYFYYNYVYDSSKVIEISTKVFEEAIRKDDIDLIIDNKDILTAKNDLFLSVANSWHSSVFKGFRLNGDFIIYNNEEKNFVNDETHSYFTFIKDENITTKEIELPTLYPLYAKNILQKLIVISNIFVSRGTEKAIKEIIKVRNKSIKILDTAIKDLSFGKSNYNKIENVIKNTKFGTQIKQLTNNYEKPIVELGKISYSILTAFLIYIEKSKLEWQ